MLRRGPTCTYLLGWIEKTMAGIGAKGAGAGCRRKAPFPIHGCTSTRSGNGCRQRQTTEGGDDKRKGRPTSLYISPCRASPAAMRYSATALSAGLIRASETRPVRTLRRDCLLGMH